MRVTRLVSLAFAVFCCACVPGVATAPGTSDQADPASMTYRSAWRESGTVTLSGGLFREQAASGSAAEFSVRLSDWRAFGMTEEGAFGTVILVTQAGGSGTFYDLALLEHGPGGWINSDVVPLGDRVNIHALSIRDGEVLVNLTRHGLHDSMCCPTQYVEQRYSVRDGRLVGASLWFMRDGELYIDLKSDTGTMRLRQ